MADQLSPPAPPPGYDSIIPATSISQGTAPTPPPANVSAPDSPPPPPPGYDSIIPATPNAKAPYKFGSGQANIDTNDNGSLWSQAGHQLGAIGAGIGKGVLDTMSGAAGLASNIDPSMVGFKQAIDEGRSELAGDNASNPGLNSIGYGGETLAEFMLGDEALKGLSFADKLDAVAKTAKVLQKSPRLMQALKAGASSRVGEALMTGARAGLVQGTQTGIRTDGPLTDRLEAGAKSAAVAAPTAGILGLTAGALSDGLTKLGTDASKVKNLTKVAENAPGKEEIAQGLSQRIGDAEEQLHQHYDNGIEDLKDRLGNSTVSAQDNPMQQRAEELLAAPDPADHPSVVAGQKAAGEGLDNSTRTFLETLANGNDPEAEAAREEAAVEAAETAPAVRLYGANDRPLPRPEPTEPEQIDARPYDIDAMIKLRQNIRAQAEKYDPGDINARTLRKLLWDPETQSSAVDDTIGQIARRSNDPQAVSDYQELRKYYRDHINDYSEPLIKNIREGKLGYAANQFVGVKRSGGALPAADRVRYNVGVLGNILGPDGLHAFGRQVFHSMLADSLEDGRLNPAKFNDTIKRITDETKGATGLFNYGDARNGLAQLAKDAKSAAALQHLTRLGLLGGLGTAGAAVGNVVGPFVPHLGAGLGTILGLTVAEGGGIAAGRTFLNWVATHPQTWETYASAGKLAASPVAGTVGQAARGVGSQVANSFTTPFTKQQIAPGQKVTWNGRTGTVVGQHPNGKAIITWGTPDAR